MSERPQITKELILEAARQVAASVDGDAETIAMHYRHPMDGYQLARELERFACWDPTMEDVWELDAMNSIVSDLHRKAETEWAQANNIQPPLAVGTRIAQGVIEGICDHMAARYLVKEDGCTQAGRFLLIRFEDARARTQEETHG
jgi:hypothetical protein